LKLGFVVAPESAIFANPRREDGHGCIRRLSPFMKPPTGVTMADVIVAITMATDKMEIDILESSLSNFDWFARNAFLLTERS
jgi:hypothetical protein